MRRVVVVMVLLLLGVVSGGAAASLISVTLSPVVDDGLSAPVLVTHAGDGSGRLFALEQPGRIRVVADGVLEPAPFLDITSRVLSGGERGLLGLAFHPRFARNGRYFVNYTRRPDHFTVIAEYRVSADPNVSESTGRVLLVIPQPAYTNHKGGMIAFGADGFLYIGMGDGGSRGDPQNRAQNPQSLLGKMLRIDVNGPGRYVIPADNPFVGGGGRPEIWALGLRNPWRFSFDRTTHELWAGDVGQSAWEEINVIRRGGNYGWAIMEGADCYAAAACDQEGLVLPVAEYPHARGRCSITGGYVYRGTAIPRLVGTYVYGDYCTGEIFGLRRGVRRLHVNTSLLISSFGEDEAGELYVVDHAGGVYRLIAGEDDQ